MNENTIIEITYLISGDSYTIKGGNNIINNAIDDLKTLYFYEDLSRLDYLKLRNNLYNNFDEVMEKICDLMELDYKYMEA